MKRFHGYTYHLAEGGWKFGGGIQDTGTDSAQYTEFDSVEKYETEAAARSAMIAYCSMNQLELVERK
jgi:hypothetical protein